MENEQQAQQQEHEKQAQPLIDQLKEYAEIRFKIYKFKAIDRGTSIAGSLIADVVVVMGILLAFIFASFTLAFYLADVFQSTWKGFGSVAGIYLLIAIIVKLAKGLISKFLANTLVRKLFKD